jgi:hypothetical protein
MKKLSKTLFLLLLGTFVVTGSYAQDKKSKTAQIKRLITSQNFVFKPEYAENVAPAQRIFGSYDVEVSKDEFSMYLPSIREYGKYMNPNSGGYNRTTSKFGYAASVNKKGTWRVIITPKADLEERINNRFNENLKVTLTVTADGYTTLAFGSRVYFTGHLEEPTPDSLASN